MLCLSSQPTSGSRCEQGRLLLGREGQSVPGLPSFWWFPAISGGPRLVEAPPHPCVCRAVALSLRTRLSLDPPSCESRGSRATLTPSP